ncbi:right-handed parallel beta-helix repeat-containing protein [Rikenella microfusus]|uniref:Alpha-1,3-galactosidase A n=1 Tax=Rikenella microfusus TaxID=28139 RepID=A0A379MRS2_9BACT|nr:right-handed parallel beta-helix repeat-containing protein [Rikenella microfusus]SUE34351.1 Alpha-1,3-galactosidase A [Rikenella microfusus]
MKKMFSCLLVCYASLAFSAAQHVIRVVPGEGDMTPRIREAVGKARACKDRPVVIEFANADYDLYRESATAHPYPVSNTTSETENPDPTKHIGLWLKNLRNVTIEGNGARLVTHGEMTAFAIDSCENITLRNFTVAAADPTVPEMTVTEVGERHMNVRIHPLSRYEIDSAGRFAFVGRGWKLSGGIAQLYDPVRDITWRSWSPLPELRKAVELEPGLLRFVYDTRPRAEAGQVFQMRDGIRDEVCGLIQYSKDITLEQLHLAFLGNFGIVGQMSENLIYRHLTFEPEPGSGRTCAGFADFVQMSGCKGEIRIEYSRFSGAHDDPINIHGTHLAVRQFTAPDQVLVRYMHPQTYGFQSFFPGNEIEFIDAHTLLPVAACKVRQAEMKNDREILITLARPVGQDLSDKSELVVENTTYTPEVVIRGNYFSRVPTRGILVTTRRRVLIENNTFFRTRMSGILIADDARSWFESGMVRDVTIRGNRFVECASPAILIAPENDRNGGYVHRNIRIENNRFRLSDAGAAVSAKSVGGLQIRGNLFSTPQNTSIDRLIRTEACDGITIEDNRIEN